MAFRFQRRLRLGKGFTLNIGKRGISSISAGVRGAHVTIGKRGTRHTVGLPGTGLSYTATASLKSGSRKSRSTSIAAPTSSGAPATPSIIVARLLGYLTRYAIIGALLFFGYRFLFHSEATSSSSTQNQEHIAATQGQMTGNQKGQPVHHKPSAHKGNENTQVAPNTPIALGTQTLQNTQSSQSTDLGTPP
ncbi:MAG: DUF4236 domain-containing protein [Terriglobales bacterium]